MSNILPFYIKEYHKYDKDRQAYPCCFFDKACRFIILLQMFFSAMDKLADEAVLFPTSACRF